MGNALSSPARWPRPVRVGLSCLALLLLAYGGAQLLARRLSTGGELRSRIGSALEDRLGPVEIGPEVSVDAAFRIRCGPITVPGIRRDDPPLARIDSLRVRPDLLALLRGRVAPAEIRLDRIRVEIPEREGSLQEILHRLQARRSSPPSRTMGEGASGKGITVRVRELTVAFGAGARRALAGPIHADILRSPGGGSVAVDLRLPGSGRGALTLRRDERGWHATSRLDGIRPRILPAELAPPAAALSWDSTSAALSGDASPDFATARAHLELTAAALRLGEPLPPDSSPGVDSSLKKRKRDVPESVGPVDLHTACDLAWTSADRKIRFTPCHLDLPGGAVIALEASAELRDGLPFALEARAAEVDYLRTLSALPARLALPPDAPHPSGSLDAHASLSGPLLDPGAWLVEVGLDLSRMRETARRAPPVSLLRPFVWSAQPEHGSPRAILVGPDNPDFVPLVDLPRHVVRAVTASEDAGFFGHSGFDFEELRNAAVEGARAGHVVRGGSTITQQLAKNLYLSREKTLARKLREAAVTVALEATVPKQRLMEIYLNIAEWGPGLWGIGPAARHWFGKDARELTPREAAFLATVIPNPVRYHYMWNRGFTSDGWALRVDDLLRTMHGQGTLTDEELLEALAQPIIFARPAPEP